VISEPGFEGRDSVAALYAMVFDSFSDVEFTHDLGDEDAHIFVAKARVLGKPMTLTTLLKSDVDGRIREIWVMVARWGVSQRSLTRSDRASPSAERVGLSSPSARS